MFYCVNHLQSDATIHRENTQGIIQCSRQLWPSTFDLSTKCNSHFSPMYRNPNIWWHKHTEPLSHWDTHSLHPLFSYSLSQKLRSVTEKKIRWIWNAVWINEPNYYFRIILGLCIQKKGKYFKIYTQWCSHILLYQNGHYT